MKQQDYSGKELEYVNWVMVLSQKAVKFLNNWIDNLTDPERDYIKEFIDVEFPNWIVSYLQFKNNMTDYHDFDKITRAFLERSKYFQDLIVWYRENRKGK